MKLKFLIFLVIGTVIGTVIGIITLSIEGLRLNMQEESLHLYALANVETLTGGAQHIIDIDLIQKEK